MTSHFQILGRGAFGYQSVPGHDLGFGPQVTRRTLGGLPGQVEDGILANLDRRRKFERIFGLDSISQSPQGRVMCLNRFKDTRVEDLYRQCLQNGSSLVEVLAEMKDEQEIKDIALRLQQMNQLHAVCARLMFDMTHGRMDEVQIPPCELYLAVGLKKDAADILLKMAEIPYGSAEACLARASDLYEQYYRENGKRDEDLLLTANTRMAALEALIKDDRKDLAAVIKGIDDLLSVYALYANVRTKRKIELGRELCDILLAVMQDENVIKSDLGLRYDALLKSHPAQHLWQVLFLALEEDVILGDRIKDKSGRLIRIRKVLTENPLIKGIRSLRAVRVQKYRHEVDELQQSFHQGAVAQLCSNDTFVQWCLSKLTRAMSVFLQLEDTEYATRCAMTALQLYEKCDEPRRHLIDSGMPQFRLFLCLRESLTTASA